MAVVGCSIREHLNKTVMFGCPRVNSKLRDPDNNKPLTALKFEKSRSNAKTAAFARSIKSSRDMCTKIYNFHPISPRMLDLYEVYVKK